MSKTNNVSMFTQSTNTQSSNLGAVKSPGSKRRENLFINSFVGSSQGGVSYVKSDTRSTVSEQGAIISGSSNTDIAVEGSGMLVVSKSANGERVFTRRGDFQQREDGYWKNGGGMLLLAWKLDNQGNLPPDANLISSLEAVNFANVKGVPIATTTVSPSMNLSSKKIPIRGAGITAAMQRAGLNSITGNPNKNDILIPENLGNSGSLTLGANFTFTSTPPNVAKTFTYGGFATSNSATATNTLYGATSAAMNFAVNNTVPLVPAAGQVPAGAQISINGTVFSFVAASPNTSEKQFSSLATLATAINKTSDLTARVGTDNRLYIAPTNANAGLAFADLNGSNMVRDLGLFTIPAAALGVNNFYSLESLERSINVNNSDASLKATIKNGNIKITSRLATASFTLTGNSLGVRQFSTIIRGDGTEKGRGTITITSPNHGLATGDLVRVTGLGGQTPDGIYAVGGINGDQFQIFVLSNNPAGAPNGTIANGPPILAPAVINTGLAANWQKVPGQKFPSVPLAAAAITNANVGVGVIEITNNGHGLVNDNVIYVSGFGLGSVGGRDVSVPDGYYRVSNSAANTFNITAVSNIGAAGAPALGNFSYQQVGSTGAGGFGAGGMNTFNSNVMVTTGGVVGGNQVKLYTTSSSYSINDYISFNLPAPVVIDAGGGHAGVTVNSGNKYKIVSTDPNFIIFEVDGGDSQFGDGDVNPAHAATIQTYIQLGGGVLPGIQVNNIGQSLKYFGINQNQNAYAVVYNPNDPLTSLAALAVNTDYSASVFVNEVEVYDSLGAMFALRFRFAKLDANKWAVSVGLAGDADGNFGVTGIRPDGQITAGTLEFDQNGNYSSYTAEAGFVQELQISRNNGSAPSSITIDWANALNTRTSASVTQYETADNSFDPSQQDGRASGILLENGLSVDADGFIWGKFDTGEVMKLYQTPIAMFANVNGLLEGSDGTYTVTRDSGQALIKAAGVGGAGSIIGGALEQSNTDTTDELLDVQEMSNVIRANARVAAVEFNNIATVLSELKG